MRSIINKNSRTFFAATAATLTSTYLILKERATIVNFLDKAGHNTDKLWDYL